MLKRKAIEVVEEGRIRKVARRDGGKQTPAIDASQDGEDLDVEMEDVAVERNIDNVNIEPERNKDDDDLHEALNMSRRDLEELIRHPFGESSRTTLDILDQNLDPPQNVIDPPNPKGKGKQNNFLARRKNIKQHKTAQAQEQDEDDDDVDDARRALNAMQRQRYHAKQVVFADRHAEEHRAKYLALAHVLAPCLGNQLDLLAIAETAVLGAVETFSHLPPVELLQAAVNAYNQAFGLTAIHPYESVWDEIDALTLEFLHALLLRGGNLDLTPFINNGTLVKCSLDDEEDVDNWVCHFYLRRFPVEDAIEAATLHLEAHIRDAPGALLQLSALSADITIVTERLCESVAPFGLEDVVKEVVRRLEDFPKVCRSRVGSDCFYYVGLATGPCAQRMQNDLDNDAKMRVVRFATSNGDSFRSDTYRLAKLDTPMQTALDIRTNTNISYKERILRVAAGILALNQAHGGTLPILLPSSGCQTLLTKLTTTRLWTSIPSPLQGGSDRDTSLALKALLEDEAQVLRQLGDAVPAHILDYTQRMAVDTLSFRHGRAMLLNVAKDITREALTGAAGCYFDETAGLGPREDRYMRRFTRPSVPETGDLTVDDVRVDIGAWIDFWRFTPPQLYNLHIAFLVRFLHMSRPVVIATQSNIVASAFHSGTYLAIQKNHCDATFWSGGTTKRFAKSLPYKVPFEMTPEEYHRTLGRIDIIPLDPAETTHSFLVVGLHYGHVKYDVQIAPLDFRVNFLTRLVIEALLCAAAKHSKDASFSLRWFKTVKAEAEDVLTTTGVLQALEIAVQERLECVQALGLLQANVVQRTAHELYLEEGPSEGREKRKALLAVAEDGPAREEQIRKLQHLGQLKARYNLTQTSSHLRPPHWTDEEFASFVRQRRTGVNLTYSLNAMGRTEDAAARAQANWVNFAVRNAMSRKTEHDLQGQNMRRALELVLEFESDGYILKDLLQSPRAGSCNSCGQFRVASNNDVRHVCPGDDNSELQVSTENFGNMDRILFPHHILALPSADLLGPLPEVLTEFDLVKLVAADVFEEHHPRLEEIIPDDYDTLIATFESSPRTERCIFVREQDLDNVNILLDYAVDVMLEELNAVPREKWPARVKSRSAWSQNKGKVLGTSEKAMQWLTTREDLFFISCRGPKANTPQPATTFIEWARLCLTRNLTTVRTIKGRKCDACGGVAGCLGRSFDEVNSILDLPYHYARQLWYNLRRTITTEQEAQEKKKTVEKKKAEGKKATAKKATATATAKENKKVAKKKEEVKEKGKGKKRANAQTKTLKGTE